MTETLGHFGSYLNKSLPTHRLIQDLKRSLELRERFRADEDAVLDRYPLSDAEREGIQARDFRRLYELGVHPYLLGQLSRLIFGTVEGGGSSEASLALVRSLNGPPSGGPDE